MNNKIHIKISKVQVMGLHLNIPVQKLFIKIVITFLKSRKNNLKVSKRLKETFIQVR